MKKALIISTFMLSLLLSSCSDSNEGGWKYGKIIDVPELQGPLELTAVETTANDKINNFAFDFLNISSDKYDEIFNGNTNGNFTISPLSATMALGLMANSGDDALAADVCRALGVDGTDVLNSTCNKLMRYLAWQDNNQTLDIANSVWYSNKLQMPDSYRNILNNIYYSEVSGVDFTDGSIADIINSWVAAKTRNMIPSVVSDVPSTTAIMYANAMYFNGEWEFKFDKEQTTDAVFHGTTTDSDVKMMHMTYLGSFQESEKGSLIKLHFKNTLAMNIMLPADGVSVEELSACLSYEDWQKLISVGRTGEITLSLPRFKIDGNADLDPLLSALNIRNSISAFGTSQTHGLTMQQKTASNIDEDGARVSSSTTIKGETAFDKDKIKQVEFNVNRPFLFFITNINSGTVLMAGRICNLEGVL